MSVRSSGNPSVRSSGDNSGTKNSVRNLKTGIFSLIRSQKAYSIVLLVSRLILSVCQSAVSLDTWSRFSKLSRAPDDIDMSLETLESFTGDLTWVPTPDIPAEAPELYGLNRLFNLYLIRLSHYFHARILSFLVYFSSIIFGLLLVMCLFDVCTIVWRRKRVKNFYLFFRFGFYCVLFGLVFSQFMFLLYYNNLLCSMEGLYPFLFVKSGDDRLELLRTGACGFSQRLIFTYVISFLTLVPDAFLILIPILPAFRSYSFLNGMKYFGSIFLLITAFIALDTRRFISLGQSAKILDYAVEKYNEEAIRAGRPESVIKLLNKSKSMKMLNMKDVISYRVFKSIKDVGTQIDPKFRVPDDKFKFVRSLVHFNFARQLYEQSKQSSFYFFLVGIYTGVITVIDAMVGTVLIIKRHKFLLPIVVIVNFFYFFTNIVHCILLQFPMYLSKIFCKVTSYATDEEGILFETLALSHLSCKLKYVYNCSFALVIFLAVLGFANVVNLYFIHKAH
ncbi:putative integral membrane protein [Theileria parva strain Muguga]|uniref:Uncharacterized protein n=1 Tax=Theileria parva TaxID=5875 RepID=Q4N2U0_THEPA|nr:putative integral membrane protein [Theileria parva strain Muguga]EAN31608.1 putative integral membrane protein [Theileria parva strain Muguga]|eukprot:XP_763891.1 hypothetical protein [Theileria parva strain Muguga]